MKERGEGGESQWRMKEEMESLPPYCFNCESLAFGTQAFTVSLNTDITARLETAHVQRERQRQRHRERQRQRQTDRQRQRQTDRGKRRINGTCKVIVGKRRFFRREYVRQGRKGLVCMVVLVDGCWWCGIRYLAALRVPSARRPAYIWR